MRTNRAILLGVLWWAPVWAAPAAGQMARSDPRVEAALEHGKAALLAAQAGGHWPAYGKGQECGPTGLAVCALLEAGVSAQQPQIVSALKWLSEQKEDQTYSLACRMLAYAAAERAQPGQWRKYLAQDARQMCGSVSNGAIRYAATGKPAAGGGYDNSNTQYALLGVWMASECNVEIPEGFWRQSGQHWGQTQNGDGGWSYAGGGKKGVSTGTMTAAGLASSFVCFDKLAAGQGTGCTGAALPGSLRQGLAWMDANFAGHIKGQWLLYYLYGVERVGLASGYKYFGKHDWYEEGAQMILKGHLGAGKAAPGKGAAGAMAVVNTSLAMLFLSRGEHPVVLNKLDYSGDWNNRPRALAHLTGWVSRMFEQTVAWQIVDVKAPVGDWHDAPILVITGSKAPTFSDEEIGKLRTYVGQGGTILSIRECGGEGFDKGMREAYRRMFPQYELTACAPAHPLYSKEVHFDVPPTIGLQAISNGVRPLAIHCQADLTASWQLARPTTRKDHYELTLNIIRYVADGPSHMRHRGVSPWPAPGGPAAKRTASLVLLRHGANPNPEPMAPARLVGLMRRYAGTDLTVLGPESVADLGTSQAKLAWMTGTGKVTFTGAEKAALVKYVSAGGTVLVDAAGGDKAFALSAMAGLREAFGGVEPALMLLDDPLFKRAGFVIDRFVCRRNPSSGRPGSPPRLLAFPVGGRNAVLFSSDDITAGVLGACHYTINGYVPQTAWEVMRNVVLSVSAEKTAEKKPDPPVKPVVRDAKRKKK